jgi:hypothetical protein
VVGASGVTLSGTLSLFCPIFALQVGPAPKRSAMMKLRTLHTHHDAYFLHKGLGVMALTHFFWRFSGVSGKVRLFVHSPCSSVPFPGALSLRSRRSFVHLTSQLPSTQRSYLLATWAFALETLERYSPSFFMCFWQTARSYFTLQLEGRRCVFDVA